MSLKLLLDNFKDIEGLTTFVKQMQQILLYYAITYYTIYSKKQDFKVTSGKDQIRIWLTSDSETILLVKL